ncbi:MAG: hypothetical protein ABJQ29_08480 [Luteolibacter sp.]
MEPTRPAAEMPVVRASTDSMPSGWSENAVFVANLLGMFFENDDQAALLADKVGAVDSYGGRLLPIIDLLFRGPGKNLLVLEHEPAISLIRFFQDVAGLSLPETTVLPHAEYRKLPHAQDADPIWNHPALERIAAHSSARIDGYVTDETLVRISRQMGKRTFSSMAGSREGNNKRLLFEYIRDIGLPVPATEFAADATELPGCLTALKKQGYRSAVIKAAMGASGIGLVKVPSLDDFGKVAGRVPHHFFHDGACLVQGWLETGRNGITELRSPSAQLFLDDTSLQIYDITEQILDEDSIHQGNESPPPYIAENPEYAAEILRQAEVAGLWLHARGYRGTASVDFLLTRSEHDFTVYICEINARVTGATYPSVLAKHFLPDGAWLLRNLRFETAVTGEKLLELLRDDLFIPGHSEHGVFPINFNFTKNGLVKKGQFLCLAPSNKENRHLLKMAKIDLPCQSKQPFQ